MFLYLKNRRLEASPQTPTNPNQITHEFTPKQLYLKKRRLAVSPQTPTDPAKTSRIVTLVTEYFITAAQLTVVALPSTNKIAPIDLVALTGDSAAPTILIKDNRAQLRAAHLSPDAPNVDIYVDGGKVLTDAPFKAVSDYLLVQSGNHQLVVTPTGTTTAEIYIPLNLEALSATTAAAVNFVANIEPLALQDDLTTPAPGNAHVRVVHASPDAPNVDVLLDGNQILTNVPFKGISA